MAFCTSCGSELPANTKFCTACGAGAGGGEEAAPGGEARPVPVTAAAPAASFPEPVPVPAPMSAAPAPVQTVPRPQPAPPQPPAYIPLADTEPTKGSRYAVISTAGYFGTILLFSLPLIGLIFCIVFACGGTKNRNRRNLAKAYLIFMIIALVLSVILVVLALVMGNWLQGLFQEAWNVALGGGAGDTGGYTGNWMDQLLQEAGGGMAQIPMP